MAHRCKSLVVTCMDYRLQGYINKWLEQNFSANGYDRVAYAGASHDLDTIMGQVELSKKLHDIEEVVLVNHENCGAYGEAGTPEKHQEDLKKAVEFIKERYPDVDVETYYLQLNGDFQKIH